MSAIQKFANSLTWDERQKFYDYYFKSPSRHVLLYRQQVYEYFKVDWADWSQEPWAQIIYENEDHYILQMIHWGTISGREWIKAIPKYEISESQIYTGWDRTKIEFKRVGLLLTCWIWGPALLIKNFCVWAWGLCRKTKA